MLIYAAILWTALDLRKPDPLPLLQLSGQRRLTQAALALVALTILAGGFVAGTHAGLIDNTYPLMENHLVPPSWVLGGVFSDPATVQFDHRVLATLALLTSLAAAAWASRVRALHGRAAAVGLAVMMQYALGVTTLLLVVPVPLAATHQAMAVLVLTALLVLLHGLRPAAPAWVK